MRGNTLTLQLRKSSLATAGKLFQYDKKQRLLFEGENLPDAYEVHFSNSQLGESKPMIGNSEGVLVPDEYLLSGEDIHLWLVMHAGEDDTETEYHGIIYVERRARPTDEEPTQEEQTAIEQAIAALNQAVEKTEAAQEAAEEAQEAAEEAQEAAEEAQHATEAALDTKADKRDTVLETTLSRGRKEDTVVGEGSFAFGTNVEASGYGSHAEGFMTVASGAYAHVEGNQTVASGGLGHAEGAGTEAVGLASHAEGFGTKASAGMSHVQGKYNVEDANGTYADIVGNGTALDNRSNAFALTWTGDGKYAGDVYVHANPDSSGGDKLATENYVDDAISQINTMSIHICTAQEYDSQTGIPTIANPDASTFYLVPGGDAPNLYIEWVYVNEAWEKFGSATIDLSNYVQKTDYASGSEAGVVKINASYGVLAFGGSLALYSAGGTEIRSGTDTFRPIVPNTQHISTFYGLAKAAGDATQSQSDNAVGTYTDEAKAAIQTMLGVPSTSDIPEYATDAETQLVITDWEVSA